MYLGTWIKAKKSTQWGERLKQILQYNGESLGTKIVVCQKRWGHLAPAKLGVSLCCCNNTCDTESFDFYSLSQGK